MAIDIVFTIETVEGLLMTRLDAKTKKDAIQEIKDLGYKTTYVLCEYGNNMIPRSKETLRNYWTIDFSKI